MTEPGPTASFHRGGSGSPKGKCVHRPTGGGGRAGLVQVSQLIVCECVNVILSCSFPT